MTVPDVRDALTEVRDRVDVPPPDLLGVATRTRRLRQRRRGVAVGGAALAVAAVVGGIAMSPLTDTRDVPVATTPQPLGIPVVLGGEVRLVGDGGTVRDSGRTGSVVGVLDGEVVTLEGGALVGPGLEVGGVRAAYVSPGGVTYQDAAGEVHRPDGGTAPGAGRLVAASDLAYVVEEDGLLTVHADGSGRHELSLGSDGSTVTPSSVEAGGDRVMVAGGGVVNFFALDGGRERGFLGGTTGALSSDGGVYAYAPSEAEHAQGMRRGLTFYDVATGRQERVPLAAAALDVAWIDDELVVLTEDGANRTLWTCDPAGCRSLLTDASGGLALR